MPSTRGLHPQSGVPTALREPNFARRKCASSNIFTLRFYYTAPQAFAWFSDLLVEHAEIFWGLFAADMDKVLAEQPPDSWDSFPLFQILNEYLRNDGKFKTNSFSSIFIRIH